MASWFGRRVAASPYPAYSAVSERDSSGFVVRAPGGGFALPGLRCCVRTRLIWLRGPDAGWRLRLTRPTVLCSNVTHLASWSGRRVAALPYPAYGAVFERDSFGLVALAPGGGFALPGRQCCVRTRLIWLRGPDAGWRLRLTRPTVLCSNVTHLASWSGRRVAASPYPAYSAVSERDSSGFVVLTPGGGFALPGLRCCVRT
ncbi:hypothetical protein STW0522RAO56_47240 [Raoultella planticola]|nr:hypothetical protein STW0522RAO56_47240 [Raoultella planticola]